MVLLQAGDSQIQMTSILSLSHSKASTWSTKRKREKVENPATVFNDPGVYVMFIVSINTSPGSERKRVVKCNSKNFWPEQLGKLWHHLMKWKTLAETK